MGRPLLMDSNDQHRQKKRRSFFFFFSFSLSFSLSLPFLSSLAISIPIFSISLTRRTSRSVLSLSLFRHSFTIFFKRTVRFLPLSTTPFIPLPLNYVFTLASSDARGFRPTLEYTSNLEHAVAAKLKRKWGGKRDLGSRKVNRGFVFPFFVW